MNQTRNPASPSQLFRAAGAFYLLIIVCGIAGEAFVRGQLVVAGDAEQTAARLLASETLFRFGIALDVVMALCDVALGGALYFVFLRADPVLSLFALVFRLVQASILGLNLQHLVSALGFADAPLLEGPQRQALMMSELNAHAMGYDLGLFFFAINCALTGLLLVRSSFAPSALGWLLGASGLVYLVGSGTHLLFPAARSLLEPAYVLPLVAEVSFAVWLLARKAENVPSPALGKNLA